MRFIILGVLALSLSACATGYKKMGTSNTVVGYDETPISKGKYRVTYRGNTNQSPSEIYALFLRRSAELAQAESAPYFVVSEGQAINDPMWTAMGTVHLPSYVGNVTMSHKEDAGAVKASDILSRYANK